MDIGIKTKVHRKGGKAHTMRRSSHNHEIHKYDRQRERTERNKQKRIRRNEEIRKTKIIGKA